MAEKKKGFGERLAESVTKKSEKKKKEKAKRDKALEKEAEFEDLMEDLDEFN